MDRDELLRVVKETFHLSELPEEVSAETIPEWDSLGHVHLIMAVEREFKVRFQMDTIPDLNSVDKIMEELC